VIVIGKLDGPTIDYASMAEKLNIPAVAADLQEIETATPYKILDSFLFANDAVSQFVGDVPLHTDNNMAVEYGSGRELNRWRTSYQNFVNLLRYRTSVIPFLTNVATADESPATIVNMMTRYEAATQFNLKGQVLFLEGQREAAFAQFEQIRALNPADLEPVEYFGASYQPAFLENASVSQLE